MFSPVILGTFEKSKLFSEFEKSGIPHIDILYNFALRMTGNKRTATKLLKETYAKAFWFYEKLDKETDLKMWLFRIMRNAYYNSYSKEVKQLTKPQLDEVEKFLEKIRTDNGNSLLEKKINLLPDDEVSEALEALPEDFKIVIILCDIEKFSYEEISDFVDVPVEVVKLRLSRARRILFSRLYKRKKF